MKKKLTMLCCSVLLFAGCTIEPPKDLFVSTPQMLEQRQLESRRYDGLNKEEILSASAAVLQDMGYTMNESETKLGIITASKARDASSAGEIAVAVAMAILFGATMPTSQSQTITISLVVRPIFDAQGNPVEKSHNVRITFQQIVHMSDGTIRAEILKDPELFVGFHDKLSKAVFLEAQKL